MTRFVFVTSNPDDASPPPVLRMLTAIIHDYTLSPTRSFTSGKHFSSLWKDRAMKPFKVPTAVARAPSDTTTSHAREPPLKRKRVAPQSDEGEADAIFAAANVLARPKARSKAPFQMPARKPLEEVPNPQSVKTTGKPDSGRLEHYTVLW